MRKFGLLILVKLTLIQYPVMVNLSKTITQRLPSIPKLLT